MSNDDEAVKPRLRRGHGRVLYVLGRDPVIRAPIAGQLRLGVQDVREIGALCEVRPEVTRASAAVVVLVDSGRSSACSPDEFRSFRARDAATVALLVMDSLARTPHQIAALARAGLDAAYLINAPNSLDECRCAAERHLSHALPWSVVDAALHDLEGDAAKIFARCLRLGDRPHQAGLMADWLQINRKTVYRKLCDEGCRPVRDLIGLGRLLHAAQCLDERAVPISAIVRILDFDSPSTLRRLVKRETGCTPTELRERGAVNTALARLKTRAR